MNTNNTNKTNNENNAEEKKKWEPPIFCKTCGKKVTKFTLKCPNCKKDVVKVTDVIIKDIK